MKYKWLILIVVIVSSCKRDLQISTLSINNSIVTEEIPMAISSTEIVYAHEGALSERGAEASLNQKPTILLPKKPIKTEHSLQEVRTYNHPKISISKNKAEIKAVKKEMDPRLSTALIMTIFGGVAVTLGLVFSKYIPAGLFVFAFGIVFVVGLITLLMYLANPKPKL